MINIYDFGLPLQSAINSTRFHHQLPEARLILHDQRQINENSDAVPVVALTATIGDGYDDVKLIAIDNRKLYKLRIDLNNDPEFITHLNRLIFNHIQIKRKESEKVGTWDSDNIWYKPNQRFHKWFQLYDIDPDDNVINKEGTNDALWAIADDYRSKKEEGEFETYRDAYRMAVKEQKKKGVVLTVSKLERAYHKAKSEGKVGEIKKKVASKKSRVYCLINLSTKDQLGP